MAVNVFKQYGIKEVANVYFEALADDPRANVYKGDIVLFLDSLKVSTIETSAQDASANGGWANPRLVSWDYGKEISVTLEDALVSLESLRFMLGGQIKKPTATDTVLVRHTDEVVCKTEGKLPLPTDVITGVTMTPTASATHPIRLINMTTGTRTQLTSGTMSADTDIFFYNHAQGVGSDNGSTTRTGVKPQVGDRVRIFWTEEVSGAETGTQALEITIDASTFPGSYRVIGDTFIRSRETGRDEAFQFVINNAKVQSSTTITLQADGDPSTFSMTLLAQRAMNEDGKQEMMKLIRYEVAAEGSSGLGDDIGSIGNFPAGN